MSVSDVSLEAYSLNLYMPRLLISQLVVVFARMTSVTLVSGDCETHLFSQFVIQLEVIIGQGPVQRALQNIGINDVIQCIIHSPQHLFEIAVRLIHNLDILCC